VHDFVAHVHGSLIARCAIVERQLNRPNRALDASAKSTRRGEKNDERHQSHLRLSSAVIASFCSRLIRAGGWAVVRAVLCCDRR
jgi:hypothetical protein